ncbi:stress responsive protein [Mycolicibacterium moriokaense]|uniref:Stress responsive protein n=1 Tax=Mycolicibacterium moriokaense TaxID=39691 RepID=A0AAD1HB12_9MYCO|nr:Dabb family protein [Mycolicibacterium moriokaense]MCV7039813.1 Dabb family protein [Mycolicibacterium moriokaense]ORB25662.1 stress responsive protein [Mycolicibacterium moriokaense]BBX01739.1 stress responsive protein [Mycolicibacterium moriokaense]
MFSVTRLIHLAPDADPQALIGQLQTTAGTSHAERVVIAPTLAGSRNGGDILMNLRFESAADWATAAEGFETALSDPAITHIDGADYRGTVHDNETGKQPTVFRALLLRVIPDTATATVERFEDDLQLLPRYVRTITSWQLSRVDNALGASPWTHVFEQDFTDVDGLMGPYLMHPIHWAYVDRWFDPECPEVIIRDRVCHSFCPL